MEGGDDATITLQPRLRWYHIFAISIGGVIGLSFATEGGEILGIAGSGGLLIAYCVNGFVAFCVMEGLCEMVVHWPISNAMIEFVRFFVDRDLAIVVGIAYWYTQVATFVGLLIGASQLLKFWDLPDGIIAVATVGAMVVMFLINCSPIMYFGNIELIGGIIKILFLFILFVIMMCINTGDIGGYAIGTTFFDDGIKNNPEVASSTFVAVLIAIPIATISYIGVEIVAVAAFEAAKPSELQKPAKNIALVTVIFYVVSVGGIAANVEWFNESLETLLSQSLVNVTSPDTNLGHTPMFIGTVYPVVAAPIIAALQVNATKIAGFLTGLLVYSGLSSANVALYVASRTLYGLTRNIDSTNRGWLSIFAIFGVVTPRTRIPIWSLLISTIIFATWMPFVKLSTGFTQAELQQVFFSIGGSGGLLVWASQCLAFIRYYKWLSMHRGRLTDGYLRRFQRWPQRGFSSWGSSLQPVLAYFGLISCLLIVFVLNGASLFNGQVMLYKALTVYLGPFILLVIFCILKMVNQKRGWVRLSDDLDILVETLQGLDLLINPDRVANVDDGASPGPSPIPPIANGSHPVAGTNRPTTPNLENREAMELEVLNLAGERAPPV